MMSCPGGNCTGGNWPGEIVLFPQYLHCSSHNQTGCKETIVSYLLDRTYSVITNKDDLTKGNVQRKYSFSFNRIFKRITINHILPQLQMQATYIQKEEIRMSIKLSYVEGTSEKLRRILSSHKIRSAFYTESTWPKLLCKQKDRVKK